MNVKDILDKAVDCDEFGRILEAQSLYQEGVQILMNLVPNECDLAKKKTYYERINEYVDRAEQIEERLQAHFNEAEIVTTIDIAEGAVGKSYHSLFGKYLNNGIHEIMVEEVELARKHHNLMTFLELVVKKCRNIKFVRVATKPDPHLHREQQQAFEAIKNELGKRNITLRVKFDKNLQDQRILLSNGILINIGRGLHYFKDNNPKFALGISDYDFRECLQTTITIGRAKFSV